MITKDQYKQIEKQVDRFVSVDHPNLSEKTVQRAISSYAKDVRPEEIVAIYDSNWRAFSSGKTGALLTATRLYSSDFKNKNHPYSYIPIEGIVKAEPYDVFKKSVQSPDDKSARTHMQVTYADGHSDIISSWGATEAMCGLLNLLAELQSESAPAVTPEPAPAAAPKPTPTATWTCAGCGTAGLTTPFCPQCGKPAAWQCPNCGEAGIATPFCPQCGTKRP